MPGRGDYWERGGLNDMTVIADDLEDGTITEAKLDSGVTAKLNAGGGIDLFDLIDPATEFFFYDDFWYEQNTSTNLAIRYELDTLANGANGGFNAFIGSNTGGGVGMSTVGIENIQSLVLGASNSPSTDIDVTKKFKLIWRFGTAETSNAFRVGFNISGGGVGGPLGTFPFGSTLANFIWFRYDGAGNVFAETDNGVTPNSTDSGVAPGTGIRTYEISSVDGSSIVFKIDGSTVATFTTNLPTGSRKIFLALQSPVAGNRTLNVDTLYLYGTR